MRCVNCGNDNQPGAKFCVECGNSLNAGCPNCGAANPPSAKFCSECGAPQRGASQQDGPEGSRGEAARRPTPVAERRLVSVLFADLVGFTAASEDRDPEDTRELLSRYFDTARRTVERYGGTVEKFIGDAVMAVWGAPTAHEDDAERAVRAALELIDAVGSLDPQLRLRAGVLTGEAAVTLGASGEGMVAGDLVNTASRLQSAASPGEVLVGESTCRATGEAIAYEPAGEQDLKGKALPVRAWRALRVVAGRGGLGRAEGIEPPFVGRDAELRQLKDLLDTATTESKAWLISIIGQPGIGKSRLVWEFEKYIDGLVQTVYWHQGRSPSYGEGITYWALGEMVRQRARIAEEDDPATTAQRLATMLAEHVADATERAWIEARLAALLGIGEAPSGERSELFAAWRRLFECISEQGTTVLVFEDLQWADPGLVDFIESLLEWSRNRPILVISLARPEILDRHPGWGGGGWNATTIRLQPLAEPAMVDLLDGIAPGLPEGPVQRILERAEGVPLYAVETVRMLLGSGRLRREGDRLELAGDLDELEVPTSLHALVAARLDALDPTDRTLLQDGAVLGQTFTLTAISALTGTPADELEPRLAALVRREVLVRVTDPRSPERGQYGFVQAIVREVAHETLSRRDRRARHLAAARYYESLGDDELAGLLANHYLEAHRASPPGPEADAVATQARLALRGAADRAAALHSHEQVVAFLSQALAIVSDPTERAALLEQAAASSRMSGRTDDAERYLREALALHRENADLHAAGLATARLGSLYLLKGVPERAIEELERGLQEVAPDDPAVPPLLAELARGYMFTEQVERALEVVERTLVAAARNGDTATVLEALTTRAPLLEFMGRLDEGVTILTGVIPMAEAHGLPVTQLRATYNLSGRLSGIDMMRATQAAKSGVELARRLGMLDWLTMLAELAGGGGFNTGDWDWVIETHEALAEGPEVGVTRIGLVQRAAAISACRGDFKRAEELIQEAAVVTREVTDVQVLMTQRWAEQDIALARGHFDEAREIALELPRLYRLSAEYACFSAALAAALGRDHAGLTLAHQELKRVEQERPLHPFGKTTLLSIEALQLAATGRLDEAIPAFRSAALRLREMGDLVQEAQLGLAAVGLIGVTHPYGRQVADEVRETFTRLRARALLERLAEMEAREPVSAG